MSDQFWLTKAQLKRLEPFFPRTRGVPRVDDRRVVSGIVRAIRNGLRWWDAPARLMTWQRKWPSWFERRQRRHRCLDMAGDCFARRANLSRSAAVDRDPKSVASFRHPVPSEGRWPSSR